jgi:Na+/melibiose symporter-like transporter
LLKKTAIEMNNDIVGGLGNQASVIFAVIAGFVAVSVWANFDKASAIVDDEANQAFAIWLDARIYPMQFETKVRKDIEDYLHTIIEDEWPKQSQGQSSSAAVNVLEHLYALLIDYVPTSEAEQAIHNQIIIRENKIFHNRRSRIHSLTLEPAIYYSLITSILFIFGLAWCFNAKTLSSHLIVTAMFSISIAIILFLIVTFDCPFRGEVSIPSEPFKEALQHIQSLKHRYSVQMPESLSFIPY